MRTNKRPVEPDELVINPWVGAVLKLERKSAGRMEELEDNEEEEEDNGELLEEESSGV